ncbi:PepSY-like domain-containing protein [Pedobacter sp.]|uniref:PepSY-like domain-containing protein n=1 Tax=Pedobacter sp. TaxID=1411316 RepID=UPI003D7FE962
MKKLIIIATAVLLFTNVSFAQDIPSTDVPSVVLNSFNKSFPKSSKVEWEIKGENYNAEFNINRRDHEVWISKTGAILKHKKELKPSELPAAVKAQINQSYAGYRIDDVDQYEVNKQFYYKVELKKQNVERKVTFDQKGKVSTIIL